MFRTPGALLPSTGLSPFSSMNMNDSLCGFYPSDTRWPTMTGMSGMTGMTGMSSMGGMGSMGAMGSSAGMGGMSSMTGMGSMTGMSSVASMSHMGQMTGGGALSLPPSLPRQNIGSTVGQSLSTPMVGCLNSGGSSGSSSSNNNVMGGHGMSSSPPSSSMYSYGTPTANTSTCESPLSNTSTNPTSQMTCSMQDMGDVWRGSSIATLRRKALEHSINGSFTMNTQRL